jgi:hypothetical protein
LISAWGKRRANPALLVQPNKQWPKVPSSPLSNFAGYAPGSVDADPSALIARPDAAKRFLSAALDDDQRDKWQLFD